MSEKIGVLIDIGNSETRFSIIRNGVATDFTYSNKYVKLEEGYSIPNEYKNEKSLVFIYSGMTYVNGTLVDKEFPKRAIAPNALKPKTSQLTTYLTLNFVFIRTFIFLSKTMGIPIQDLNVSFDVRLLLPPSEHDRYSDEFKTKVQEITSVSLISPYAWTKNISINSIMVLPEGATAYIGSIYQNVNDSLVVIPENEAFISGDVLVIDIGAGTTDIVRIKDTEIVVNSKETFNIGGMNIASYCSKLLYQKYGYFPRDEAMENVIATCQLVKGNETIDVSALVNSAKDNFSAQLEKDLTEYLLRNDITIQEVKGLLIVGGGALGAERDGVVISPPVSEVFINYIKELASSIALVSTKNRNPRTLNLEGLKLYYRFI